LSSAALLVLETYGCSLTIHRVESAKHCAVLG
jgi:hypothetical protein